MNILNSIFGGFEKTEEEKELEEYIQEIDQQLEFDNSDFVNGDGIYVGTKVLRDFYKGKQWLYRKEGGAVMRTYNYCFSVVENMTSFLANETPEIYSVPRDIADPYERARSEGITEYLAEIHRINKLPLQFQKGVRIGSLTGMTFIFGAVYDADSGAITYQVIENPENIRPIWRDSNFSSLQGFINRYEISVKSFKKNFKKQIKERGIDVDNLAAINTKSPKAEGGISEPAYRKARTESKVPMVSIREYYDDEFFVSQVIDGNGKVINIDFLNHDYGFVPGILIPNIHLPGEGKGTSDIENVLDSQVAYNESKSNEEDIIRQVAFTALWGKNLDNYSVIQTGVGSIYNFNDEAELNPMPRSANPLVLENFERGVQGDLINLSGQNQALYPGGAKGVLASTGRALSVMMQGINNKVSCRKTFWKDALETLNRNILILTEKKIENGKELIGGNYRTDVFISSVLLRDVTEEINKFNAKLQSMTTTQKNLGISSPSGEQKLMKEELKDPIFSVEISRQPALLQSIIQQELQAMLGGGGEGMTMAGGEGGEENPEQAIMAGGEGEPAGKQPAASPQQRGASRTSPEGAVRAEGQRKTGAPLVRSTR